MKTSALKIALFLIGVVLSWIPLSAQSSDSLYCAPIKKIRQLVAVAQRVPGLEREIEALDSVVTRMSMVIYSDSVVKRTKDLLIENYQKESNAYKGLYESQLKLTKAEEKEKKKWRRITFVAGIASFGLLILAAQ